MPTKFTSSKLFHLALITTLGFLWGSSFGVTRIAVEYYHPYHIATLRVIIATVILAITARCLSLKFPISLRIWQYTFFCSIILYVIPLFLITWAQQYISSGMAGVLISSVPLMTLLLSHFTLHEERMTFPKVFGILAGLCGILILLDIGKIWLDMTESISHINLIAQFTCLSGAFCYASSTVVIKKSPDCHPIVFSTIALIFSSIIFIAAAPLAGVPAIPDIEIKPFLAIIYLGVFSTALAAVLAVYIIRIAGTIFLSLGNYQEPVWALLIGSIFFNEAIPSQIIIALPLIIFGIAIATLSEKKRKITTNDSQ